MKRVREKFLPHEDSKLRALVAEYGEGQWKKVAEKMPNRNPRQCRERWKHYICSDTAKAPWKPEEDILLFHMVKELGFKWTKISKYLPGRTDIQVKTRWIKKFQNNGNQNPLNQIQFSMEKNGKQKPTNQLVDSNTTSPNSVETEIEMYCKQMEDFKFDEFKNTETDPILEQFFLF